MKVAELIRKIKAGKTLYICTALRTITINAKTLASWDKAGFAVLKDGGKDEKGFYVGRGRNYDYVSPLGCKVYLE